MCLRCTCYFVSLFSVVSTSAIDLNGKTRLHNDPSDLLIGNVELY